jgi:ABC-2 type transport system permease protein
MSTPVTTATLVSTVWQRELVEFTQRRQALAIKLAYPLVLGIPLLFSRVPVFDIALALTMLVGLTSALGTGAVLSRERASGLALRYRLLPVRPGTLLVERLGVYAVIDVLQFAPLLILIGLRHPEAAAFWPALVVTIAASMLAGNLLGAFVSTLSRAPAEVMLYTIIPLLAALYLSGVFVSSQQPVMVFVSRLLPFSYLHEALLGSLGAGASLAAWEAFTGGLGFIAGALALTGLLGRRIVEAA